MNLLDLFSMKKKLALIPAICNITFHNRWYNPCVKNDNIKMYFEKLLLKY